MGSCLSFESRSPVPGSPRSPAMGGKKRKTWKKRLGSHNSSIVDYQSEDPLHRIPGRMFLNGSSEVASLFTQQGRKGTNQDAMVVWENFGSRSDTIFCGVFDGHGPDGHLVARRVRDSLPLKVKAQWEFNSVSEEVLPKLSPHAIGRTIPDEGGAAIDGTSSEKPANSFCTLKESFLKASKIMDRELRMHPNIDSFSSGTTAVTLVKQGDNLVVGNVGDSRAVMATRDEEDDSLVAVQLTVDLKPNLPGEEERIRSCKGRVFALPDEPEVVRVWLPYSDSPGLAMARAFGDFCLKDFGLISVPEITCHRLTDKDEFIVLATDGIWDVLSNAEVVEIVATAPSQLMAAEAVVETAVQAWRCKYPTSKADDCAAVCLFLNPNPIQSHGKNSKVLSSASNEISEDDISAEARVCNGGPANSGDISRRSDLNRSGTTRTIKDILGVEEEGEEEDSSGEKRSEWSALEGVTRVNTMLTLPRFVPRKKEKAR